MFIWLLLMPVFMFSIRCFDSVKQGTGPFSARTCNRLLIKMYIIETSFPVAFKLILIFLQVLCFVKCVLEF